MSGPLVCAYGQANVIIAEARVIGTITLTGPGFYLVPLVGSLHRRDAQTKSFCHNPCGDPARSGASVGDNNEVERKVWRYANKDGACIYECQNYERGQLTSFFN